MNKLFQRIFGRNQELLTAREIILWWEVRRLPFNLMVGGAGAVSIASGVLTALFTSSECGIPDSPLFALMGIVLYAVVANVMYSGGWVVELLLRPFGSTQKFAQVAFAAGLILSVIVTISPAVVIPIACTVGGGAAVAHLE